MTYLDKLAEQENARLYEADNLKVKPNVAPEDKGGSDIGFGHKLTDEELKSQRVHGIDISDGITKEDAITILEIDRIKHRVRAEMKVGSDVWRELPEAGKNLLTDYSFTGVIDKFPKMLDGIISRDKETVLNEYERSFTKDGKLKPMKRRNELSLELINKMEDYFNV